MALGDILPPATSTTPGVVTLGGGIPKNNPPGVLSLRGECGVLYVAPDGDDVGGDGSQTNPYATLLKAFAYATANPLPGGWEVNLPGCTWEEDPPLPPPGTRLRGHGSRSILRGVGGGPIAWAEGATNAGTLYLEDVHAHLNLVGRNGGDFNLVARHGALTGAIARLGTVKLDSLGAYPTLGNILSLQVTNTQTRGVNLTVSYAPSGGVNGLGAPGHLVDGGSWGTITYNSEDNTNELHVIGAEMNVIRAEQQATIRTRASRVVQNVISNDAGTLVEYDQMIHRMTPGFLGAGRFSLSEFICSETIPANFVDSSFTVCVPKHPIGTVFDRIFVSFERAGYQYEYQSNTDSDIQVRIIPPAPNLPAVEAHFLVRPRLWRLPTTI